MMKLLTYFSLLLLFACFSSALQSQNDDFIDEVAWEHKRSGFNNHTEVGYLFNTQKENEERGLSLRHTMGYMFHPAIAAGVGIGYDQYESQSVVPVFVELKGDFISGEKYSPFYFGQFGTAFSTTEDEEIASTNEQFTYDGGTYFQVGLGVKMRSRQNMDWTFSVGYINQDSSSERIYDDPLGPGRLSTQTEQTNSRISARIGFMF